MDNSKQQTDKQKGKRRKMIEAERSRRNEDLRKML